MTGAAQELSPPNVTDAAFDIMSDAALSAFLTEHLHCRALLACSWQLQVQHLLPCSV
jgi:hypothetical protein